MTLQQRSSSIAAARIEESGAQPSVPAAGAEADVCLIVEGCYPYVQYPSGKCDKEQFGTFCAPGGTGKQGDPCGGSLCASNFVCVITGVGTQCVQLCPLVGDDKCPNGLFCVPIDVEGYGGCF